MLAHRDHLLPRTPPATAEVHGTPLLAIAAVLRSHRVRYCVIGGLATGCWVYDRVPQDLDIVIPPTSRAASRTAQAIEHMQRTLSSGQRSFHPAAAILGGVDQRVCTPWGQLDIVGLGLPETVDRLELLRYRTWWRLGGELVPIVRRADLIAIKMSADHGRDRLDVAALERTAT